MSQFAKQIVPGLYVTLGVVVYLTHGTWAPALLHTIQPVR